MDKETRQALEDATRNRSTEPLAASDLQQGDLLLCFRGRAEQPVFREVFEVAEGPGDQVSIRVSDRTTPFRTLYVPRDLVLTRQVIL